MVYINHFIPGIPYSRNKRRGDISAPARWTKEVIRHTCGLAKVQEACALHVTFLLPKDKYPADLPYGPDLDNLLKRLLDALNETIFSETPGHDSCVVLLQATKSKAPSPEKVGAYIEVLPISVT